MILKVLLILTLSSFVYADDDFDIKKLVDLTAELAKAQEALANMMEEESEIDIEDEIPEDIYFPDDSYLGLKCIRDRDTISIGDTDFLFIASKDDFGMYYHKPYVNVEYFSISPSQKKGMVVYWFNYWRNKDTDMYTFIGDEYSQKGPYESEEFTEDDYSYVIKFRDSAEVHFNREDLSFSFWNGRFYSKAGSCEILEIDDFYEDIESRIERVEELKERNQQIIDAKKAKRKF